MKVHDVVDDLERQVATNIRHNELLTIDNLDAGTFGSRNGLVHLFVVFCLRNDKQQEHAKSTKLGWDKEGRRSIYQRRTHTRAHNIYADTQRTYLDVV